MVVQRFSKAVETGGIWRPVIISPFGRVECPNILPEEYLRYDAFRQQRIADFEKSVNVVYEKIDLVN